MNGEDNTKTVPQLRSELARTQQQLADMAAAQEAFLRAVSHDLRAPLRHVTSYGALVRETLAQDLPADVQALPAVQDAQRFLTTMDQSARRMGQMIDSLLALARVGQVALHLGPVSLAAAVDEARGDCAGAEAGRAVAWQVPADLPVLAADRSLLRELLVQVLGNALKFTRDQAAPAITVSAQPAADGRVVFTVQDNGVGFDPARAAGLFGVFQRLHRETDFAGVGGGLALCQAIAQRHGAAISATAVPGEGCTVRLDWPAAAEVR